MKYHCHQIRELQLNIVVFTITLQCHLSLEENMQSCVWTYFTSREEVNQLNDEGSQEAAPSVGQSEEVQGDPPDVARGQLEGYEGTWRGSGNRNV